MDVAAIREDLVGACPEGYMRYAYVPDTVQRYPAVIAGTVRSIVYGATLGGLCVVTLALTVAVAGDKANSQKELDAAISSGSDGTMSIPDALSSVSSTEWSVVHVTEVEEVRSVTDGSTTGLAQNIIVEVHTSR